MKGQDFSKEGDIGGRFSASPVMRTLLRERNLQNRRVVAKCPGEPSLRAADELRNSRQYNGDDSIGDTAVRTHEGGFEGGHFRPGGGENVTCARQFYTQGKGSPKVGGISSTEEREGGNHKTTLYTRKE